MWQSRFLLQYILSYTQNDDAITGLAGLAIVCLFVFFIAVGKSYFLHEAPILLLQNIQDSNFFLSVRKNISGNAQLNWHHCGSSFRIGNPGILAFCSQIHRWFHSFGAKRYEYCYLFWISLVLTVVSIKNKYLENWQERLHCLAANPHVDIYQEAHQGYL